MLLIGPTMQNKQYFWLNMGFPKGGGGSDIWRKFPNNPIIFLESLSYFFPGTFCWFGEICALLGMEGPWMVFWSVRQIEFDRQGPSGSTRSRWPPAFWSPPPSHPLSPTSAANISANFIQIFLASPDA